MEECKGSDGPVNYEIRVQGRLREDWSDWLDDMSISFHAGVTKLSGAVADQAALRGILIRVWDLGLKLLSVSREVCDE
jgi:hypothetical protein